MKIPVIVSCLLLVSVLHAQEFKSPFARIGFTQGFGYYQQSDHKDLNNDVKDEVPFDLVTVNNFPVRIFWGGYLTIPLGIKANIGMDYEFHSTGSRIGQKDYSGSYSFDQILSSHVLSFSGEILLTHAEHPWGYFRLNAGADFASWELREKISISSMSQEDKILFRTTSLFAEPALVFKWNLNRRIGLSIRSGYHISFGGEYHNPDNKNISTDVKPGWGGPRLSFNLEYNLYNEYKKRE